MDVFARRPCRRCRRDTDQELSRAIRASGMDQFGWWCLECKPQGWAEGGMWIPKESLYREHIDLDAVRVVKLDGGARCVRCGAWGSEQHHWAPRKLFGDDADNWPVDPLCKACHDEWHRRVTPSLVSPLRLV